MNESKFFTVNVGTRTRAGNLNTIVTFVAKSDKTQNQVYSYYSKKYTGLSIEVSEITEIVNDEITINETNNTAISYQENKKIRELESRVKELSSSFNRFSGKIRYNTMTSEITLGIEALEKINNDYSKNKAEIKKAIESYIVKKYGSVITSDITVGEWNHNTADIPFTGLLKGSIKGSIKPSDNEL
jgi:hypothetical protein